MSVKIQVQTTIRDLNLAEEAMKKLGFNFTKDANGSLRVKRSYQDLVVKADGSVDCDSMDKGMVVSVKKEYNRAMVIKEVETNGEIYDIIEPTTSNGDIRIIVH